MKESIEKILSELVAKARLIPQTGSDFGIKLNLGMRQSYDFYRVTFAEQQHELLLIVVKVQMPVDLIERQYLRFQAQSERPILFAFGELKARMRDRLVRRKVPFIIPGKFLFAPMLGYFGETPQFEAKWGRVLTPAGLSSWAETILIKYLLDDNLESVTGVELAKLFQVTPMTVSRALRDLEDADLCCFVKHGTEKRAHFESKDRLWAKAVSLLTSPVVATVGLAVIPEGLPLSGESALEHYSMLVGLPLPTYAIGKREFLALKKGGGVLPPKPGEEKLRLEIWKRDPRVLAMGNYVDPISLYLCLRNSPDERIQSEALKMMTELGLKVSGNE